MEDFLKKKLKKIENPFDSPTEKEWIELEEKIDTFFSEDFKELIDLLTKYRLDKEIFNISKGRTNGNPLLDFVYQDEVKNYNWNPLYIPFCDIGNGDYFCIKKENERKEICAIYYYDHEDDSFEKLEPTVKDWVEKIEEWTCL